MKNKTIYLIVCVAGLSFLGVLLVRGSSVKDSRYDEFAKCLAEKGTTMYGASWCPHCQNEKKEFGSSFKYVPYVECPKDPKRCLDLGIQGYPTWILEDGRKLVGEQGLEKIAQESGCALPTTL